MADATIFGLTQETAMTAAARLAVQKTAASTRATSATFALLGGLEVKTSSPTTGNVSPAAGEFHWLDVSGMTANRDFILPVAASIQTGERIGVGLSVGDAGFVLQIKSGAAGDLINGVDHSSTIWSSLFITGEVLIFRCIDGATGNWVVEVDGRIPQAGALSTTTAQTNYTTSAFTQTVLDTEDYDVGDIVDAATNRSITVRRIGRYIVSWGASIASMADGDLIFVAIFDGTSERTRTAGTYFANAAGGDLEARITKTMSLIAGDEVDLRIFHNKGSDGTHSLSDRKPMLAITEII